jgi:hypothetical protein
VRISTVVITGGVVAAVGFGAYKLGHGVDTPANELATVAVAMPQEAAVATAEANLSGAVSAVTSYQADHGGYAGMTTGGLRSYDAGLAGDLTVKSASAAAYCIQDTVDTTTVSIRGPNGSYVVAPC